MAGRNSAECKAKLLILNHISPKLENDLPGTAREAYEASNQTSSVAVAFDFMEVVVPWMGFGSSNDKIEEGEEEIDGVGNESTRDSTPEVKTIIQRLFG
jgi:hypothetical protein